MVVSIFQMRKLRHRGDHNQVVWLKRLGCFVLLLCLWEERWPEQLLPTRCLWQADGSTLYVSGNFCTAALCTVPMLHVERRTPPQAARAQRAQCFRVIRNHPQLCFQESGVGPESQGCCCSWGARRGGPLWEHPGPGHSRRSV